eukprot:1194788-Prorocentrum_minimum.AAC.1
MSHLAIKMSWRNIYKKASYRHKSVRKLRRVGRQQTPQRYTTNVYRTVTPELFPLITLRVKNRENSSTPPRVHGVENLPVRHCRPRMLESSDRAPARELARIESRALFNSAKLGCPCSHTCGPC